MKATKSRGHDIKLGHAALVAGVGYLLTPTPFSEFYIWPHLVIPTNIEQTEHNIIGHHNLFAAAILCYLISYVFDVVIAWALYYLLKPVSASLALLAAWFQLVYTAVGLTASLNLTGVLRLLTTPQDVALFGGGFLHGQIRLMLSSFHATWGLSLIFFGIHLVLVGYLIFKSGYIPKLVGVFVAIAGLGYVI